MDAIVTVESASISADLKKIAQGEPGLSAYEVAVKEGYTGTEAEWVAYLSTNADQAIAAANAAKASQDAAEASATAAATSENMAATSASAASASETAAASSASAAIASETNAAASENAAKTSETNAKASETAAATSAAGAATAVTAHNISDSAHAAGISGNAATATKLEAARMIGGVSFDGSSNIDLPGVNIAGTQDTSGNAATASALQTLARSTAYAVGDLSAAASLPFGLVLYCSTAGTTDSSAVSI